MQCTPRRSAVVLHWWPIDWDSDDRPLDLSSGLRPGFSRLGTRSVVVPSWSGNPLGRRQASGERTTTPRRAVPAAGRQPRQPWSYLPYILRADRSRPAAAAGGRPRLALPAPPAVRPFLTESCLRRTTAQNFPVYSRGCSFYRAHLIHIFSTFINKI